MAFYSQQRLQHQLNMVETSYGDRETRELWAALQVHIAFDPSQNIHKLPQCSDGYCAYVVFFVFFVYS